MVDNDNSDYYASENDILSDEIDGLKEMVESLKLKDELDLNAKMKLEM